MLQKTDSLIKRDRLNTMVGVCRRYNGYYFTKQQWDSNKWCKGEMMGTGWDPAQPVAWGCHVATQALQSFVIGSTVQSNCYLQRLISSKNRIIRCILIMKERWRFAHNKYVFSSEVSDPDGPYPTSCNFQTICSEPLLSPMDWKRRRGQKRLTVPKLPWMSVDLVMGIILKNMD